MPEPIEIRPEDILRRPLNLVTQAAGKAAGEGGFSIKNIKGYIQQFKEIKELAESLGLDLSSFGLKIPGQKKDSSGMPEDRAPALTGAAQFRNFLKLLEAKYGDITVTELLEKLKAEFGDWKISSFTKGGLV